MDPDSNLAVLDSGSNRNLTRCLTNQVLYRKIPVLLNNFLILKKSGIDVIQNTHLKIQKPSLDVSKHERSNRVYQARDVKDRTILKITRYHLVPLVFLQIEMFSHTIHTTHFFITWGILECVLGLRPVRGQ